MKLVFLISTTKEHNALTCLLEYIKNKGEFEAICINVNPNINRISTLDTCNEIFLINPSAILYAQHLEGVGKIVSLYSVMSPDTPIIHLDHGVSFLKWFIHRESKHEYSHYLLSNPVLKRLYEHSSGIEGCRINWVGYPRADSLLTPSCHSREDFCNANKLDANVPIILYAPSWIPDNSLLIDTDYATILSQLDEIPNTIMIQHVDGVRLKPNKMIVPNNDGFNIVEAMKHSDLVITDVSSILFEAASINKRVLQVLHTSYPDNYNNIKPFELPRIAVIDQPFVGAMTTLPSQVKNSVEFIINNTNVYDKEFKSLLNNVGSVSKASYQQTSERIHDNIKALITSSSCVVTPSKPITIKEYQDWFGYPRCLYRKDPNDVVVITFGTYDLSHKGHVEIIRRAKKLGTRLIVGVSSDDFNYHKKKRYPVMSESERMKHVESYGYAEHVFLEEAFEFKRHYISMYQADVLVMGDDWKGRMDEYSDMCRVVYLPRTPNISTTELVDAIKNSNIEDVQNILTCNTVLNSNLIDKVATVIKSGC